GSASAWTRGPTPPRRANAGCRPTTRACRSGPCPRTRRSSSPARPATCSPRARIISTDRQMFGSGAASATTGRGPDPVREARRHGRETHRPMFLARVTGSVVATQKVASMTGHKLLTVEPYRVDGPSGGRLVPTGRTFVVVDALGAGLGE